MPTTHVPHSTAPTATLDASAGGGTTWPLTSSATGALDILMGGMSLSWYVTHVNGNVNMNDVESSDSSSCLCRFHFRSLYPLPA